ncbi:DUF1491 family protein [Fulvimarina endophytica]|uniref:DUF1491 family protein n=1 Tax=Fulvimarina endophytica TaxID=2293836 RepID=A0A371WYN3_9HYPH|nr:DUF1491 family protein [Fulvimarina endophytica]RFC62100.1 DUF1491 family protein [Fulvimarina endophytica]
MRITSELFVAQLVRRVFNDGGFAAVERKGAASAGAIFVTCRDRQGRVILHAPAIQSLVENGDGRAFMREEIADEEALRTRFEREARFDPDFWLVEIETDAPETYLDIVET